MPKNASTLICQLGKLHISDWLTKVKQIYKPSCLLSMISAFLSQNLQRIFVATLEQISSGHPSNTGPEIFINEFYLKRSWGEMDYSELPADGYLTIDTGKSGKLNSRKLLSCWTSMGRKWNPLDGGLKKHCLTDACKDVVLWRI